MSNPFTDHPTAVGESYVEHFAVSSGVGMRMIRAGLACLVHAVFPFAFQKTGSSEIKRLHERIVANRSAEQGGWVI
jgi:hypothetical protein